MQNIPLKDLVVYLFLNYPNPGELSRLRLLKMLYLVDWKFAIDREMTLTGIEWEYTDQGVEARDSPLEFIQGDPDFVAERLPDQYGTELDYVKLSNNHIGSVELYGDEKETLDHIIEVSYTLSFAKLIQLINSTYPVISSKSYSVLDLVESAKAYKKFKQLHAMA